MMAAAISNTYRGAVTTRVSTPPQYFPLSNHPSNRGSVTYKIWRKDTENLTCPILPKGVHVEGFGEHVTREPLRPGTQYYLS